MSLPLDEYAHLDSPVHRWEPRAKLVALLALIFAFALVRDLRLLPFMLALTAVLYKLSRLPLPYLLARLRYPGYFLITLSLFLAFFGGSTVLVRVGPLALRREGVGTALLFAGRFGCILTVGLVLFGTMPFTTTIKTMRRLGLPSILTDMMLLSYRYLFEFGDTLATMQRAIHLRGFKARLSVGSLSTLALLAGSLLVRSYEQAERVYDAMRLRGYGRSNQRARQSGGAALLGDETPPALVVESLSFAYPNGPQALDGVSFRVMPGERVGLIGSNGAGKSTLFSLVCGLLKPEAGALHLFGQPVKPGHFNPAVNLVFQNPDDQLFSPLVRDDVAFGPTNMGLPEDEVEQRVAEALAFTGTTGLADRQPHHLSSGQKRMVAIAGVIAMYPKLLLYDEPDANLDARSRQRLIQFLQNSTQTLIVASHDLALIREVCSRVILLDEGRIIADGPPRAVADDAVRRQLAL